MPILTQKLANIIKWTKIEPSMTTDAILLAYADRLGLDGVWWNDTLSPETLSAPRGGILPNRLNEWKAKQTRAATW